MSGRFSAPSPPRKRSSRPSLSLYLDFPLTSNLTLASDHFLLSHPPLQVRVRALASASSAAAAATRRFTAVGGSQRPAVDGGGGGAGVVDGGVAGGAVAL